MRTTLLALAALTAVACDGTITPNTTGGEETPTEIADATGLTHYVDGTTFVYSELAPTGNSTEFQLRLELDTTGSGLEPEGMFYWLSDVVNGEMEIEDIYSEQEIGEDGSVNLITGITGITFFDYAPAGGSIITFLPRNGTTALGIIDVGYYCPDQSTPCTVSAP